MAFPCVPAGCVKTGPGNQYLLIARGDGGAPAVSRVGGTVWALNLNAQCRGAVLGHINRHAARRYRSRNPGSKNG